MRFITACSVLDDSRMSFLIGKTIANYTQMYILTINTIIQQKIFGIEKNRTLKNRTLKNIKFKILRYSVSSLLDRELNSAFNNPSLNVTILLEV